MKKKLNVNFFRVRCRELSGDWEGGGKLYGSAQPGSSTKPSITDDVLLSELASGADIKNLDEKLYKELEALHDAGIRTIYNLLDHSHNDTISRNPLLIKYLWENHFADTKYITEIHGTSTSVENAEAHSQAQIELITNDAAARINNGENILVHCLGGTGRTGAILAAIYMKLKNIPDADQAVGYVRTHYNPSAIDNAKQHESLQRFALRLEFTQTLSLPSINTLRPKRAHSSRTEAAESAKQSISFPDLVGAPYKQSTKDLNILLAEPTSAKVFGRDSEQRAGVYTDAHEHSSTESTCELPAELRLYKKSNVSMPAEAMTSPLPSSHALRSKHHDLRETADSRTEPVSIKLPQLRSKTNKPRYR